MSDKRNDKSFNVNDSSTSSTLSTDLPHDDSFIDDYSHLRLSYYQVRDVDELSSGFGDTHYDPNLTESDVTTCEMTQMNVSSAFEDERQKLRDYLVSQLPDLPPPSFTVASIVSSASRRMNSGYGYFKYEAHIEQGKGHNTCKSHCTFSPNRRSTLIPQPKK